MTIRFAAANHGYSSAVARTVRRSVPLLAANDNLIVPAGDRMLDVALRHFARHGLSAAKRARENAEAAAGAGDPAGYDWWLSVCRTLDRRMADALAASAATN